MEMQELKALNRKPNLSVRKSMELEDGTRIDVVGITARIQSNIANNQKLSNYDRGIHITAAKVRINGQPVVYDDLLNCFTSDELEKIVAFANDIDEKDKDGGKNEKNV